jgi:hypothetical protein
VNNNPTAAPSNGMHPTPRHGAFHQSWMWARVIGGVRHSSDKREKVRASVACVEVVRVE